MAAFIVNSCFWWLVCQADSKNMVLRSEPLLKEVNLKKKKNPINICKVAIVIVSVLKCILLYIKKKKKKKK